MSILSIILLSKVLLFNRTSTAHHKSPWRAVAEGPTIPRGPPAGNRKANGKAIDAGLHVLPGKDTIQIQGDTIDTGTHRYTSSHS